MAVLTRPVASLAGTVQALVAAAAGGDKFPPGDHTMLVVKNADATPKTVTIDSVTPSNYGTDADVVVVVAAGETRYIGPFPAQRFASPTDGLVSVTYSAVVSVTVGPVDV